MGTTLDPHIKETHFMDATRYVAKTYVAGSPDAEVIGQIVLSFTENLRADLVKPILPRYGLDNVDPEEWYPHQAWMNVLQDIAESEPEQAGQVFVAFGMKAVEKAVMPPELDTIEKVLNALHAIHHANLRNIPADEGYHVEKKGEGHLWVYQNTPNPDSAIYGFIYGMAQRFCPEGEDFLVEMIPNPNPDVHPGALYEVKWGPEV
jgi:hypothetical protein